jgi:hypothetical protein
MFLLLTDYHSGKKSLVNFDSVRRVDVFQEAYALVTFIDHAATPLPCKESFSSLVQHIEDVLLGYVHAGIKVRERTVSNIEHINPIFPDQITGTPKG